MCKKRKVREIFWVIKVYKISVLNPKFIQGRMSVCD